jgi:alpha-N-arabinofuranosidase
MTEEINHSYDGGLYGELIQNRAFMDDAQAPRHWSVVQSEEAGATIALDRNRPRSEQQPASLRLDVTAAAAGHRAGVANDGYWGIPVRSLTRYTAKFYARANAGFSGSVTLAIQSEDGKTVYAKAKVAQLTDQWRSYTATLSTGKVVPTAQARFVLTVERPGSVWLSYVSLFPPTWKHRPNGLRPDLMQALVDLKPGFLRFPGGNYLEGNAISERFDWKKTLGPPENRPSHPCSTDGMGLLEFLYWCEDMGAEPPRAWSSSSAPYATASLAQKTAVGRGAGPSSSSFIWSRPLFAVKSPTRIKPSSKAIPASSSAHW